MICFEDQYTLKMCRVIRISIILYFCVLRHFVRNEDPCDPNVYITSLTHLDLRNPENIGNSESAICDRYIAETWYRVDSYFMTAKAPEAFACGTDFPIWMNDTVPPVGNTAEVQMCVRRYSDPCSSPFTIEVKNCGSFVTYFLKPPSICNSAYCFEWNTDCVNKTVDSVNVEFNGFQWTQSVKETGEIEHDSALQFLCNFMPLSNENLYYRIVWYLDNLEADLDQVFTASTKTNATISAYDILKFGKKLGTMIKCRVGAMFKDVGKGCKTKSSLAFFAGIKVLTPQVSVSTLSGASIKLQSNIPFADNFVVFNNKNPRNLSIHLANPKDTDIQCKGVSMNYYKCEQKIPSLPFDDRFLNDGKHPDWNKIIDFNVVVMQSTQTNIPPSHVTLRLKTGGIQGKGSKFFDNEFLQDIVIQKIADDDSALPSCSSLTDPHFKTFDGILYENQIDGTFILYRNDFSNQEVQVIQEVCYPSYQVFCNCAVAVRSGRDIFVIDVCSGIDNKIIDFVLCEDKVLDPVKVNEKLYDIRMPSGTTVTVVFREWPLGTKKWQLDITVTPSSSDKHNTSGLCGIFDGQKLNDFTRSSGEQDDVNTQQSYFANYPDNFIKSWSFTYNFPGKSLFTQDSTLIKNLPSINETSVLLCACRDSGITDCSYDHSVRCKNSNGAKLSCKIKVNSNSKKMQYARPSDKKILGTNNKIFRRPRSFVMSEGDAESICFDAFSKSATYKTCADKVTEFTNTSLTNCVMDLMLTGDENITNVHTDASNQECSIAASQNVTFQILEPYVIREIEEVCLNNCSGQGICMEGNCTCFEGFAGTDCSFDKYAPPKLSPILEVSICDRSTDSCGSGDVYGEFFFENTNTYCYINRTVILSNASKIQEFLKSSITVRTLFNAECPLLQSDDDEVFATYFTFAITNDETRFTEKRLVYTYQSHCQDFQNKSGQIAFVLKSGYCFINQACVADGTNSSIDSCLFCSTEKSQYQWTLSSSCAVVTKDESNHEDKLLKTEIIIGISVAGAVILIVLVIVLLQYMQRKGVAKNRKIGITNEGAGSSVTYLGK